MPPTTVLFYEEEEYDVPVLDWLERLKDKQAVAKLNERIERLEGQGFALGRPMAAPLRDQISELRARSGRVQFRILYCFHERRAILLHGLTKEGEVPDQDIKIALTRRRKLFDDPKQHIFDPMDEESESEEE